MNQYVVPGAILAAVGVLASGILDDDRRPRSETIPARTAKDVERVYREAKTTMIERLRPTVHPGVRTGWRATRETLGELNRAAAKGGYGWSGERMAPQATPIPRRLLHRRGGVIDVVDGQVLRGQKPAHVRGQTADASLYAIAQDRNATITELKRALKSRSGKVWSVTGGHGTAWGWITIQSVPARRGQYGYMTDGDREELARLLGLERVHNQGESVPASTADRLEYIQRANGLSEITHAAPYWD